VTGRLPAGRRPLGGPDTLIGTGTLRLVLDLPPEALEAVAQRAATILDERSNTVVGSSENRFLNVCEAAEYLRTSRQRIYDLLSSGRLRRYKDGSRVLVLRAEIDAYLSDGGRRPQEASPCALGAVCVGTEAVTTDSRVSLATKRPRS
jgi:excisionase family DNA binding protein